MSDDPDHTRRWLVRASGAAILSNALASGRVALVRASVRPCDARHGRQRGSARCQMQKSSTRKFHSDLPDIRGGGQLPGITPV